MCVCVCLYVEPVSRFKDYAQSQIKNGSVVCLYTPVLPSVLEMEATYATGGILFLRMYLRWSLYTLYLLARQVELPWAIQVFVVVSLVCRALLFPFVC